MSKIATFVIYVEKQCMNMIDQMYVLADFCNDI